MQNLRKKVPNPLRVYNLFNQIYYRYFSDINIRSGKQIKSVTTKDYLTFFVENHFKKINTFDNLKHYILWTFKEKGKFPINHLHLYIEEWLRHESDDIIYFADAISAYLRNNDLTIKEYLAPVPRYYPHIIQHYIGQKNIPFEFILYTKVIDKIPKKQLTLLKVLLSDEFYDMDTHIKRMKKGKGYLSAEVERLKKLI